MDNQIELSDNISMLNIEINALNIEINAARVFLESYNDKLDHMMGLFLDAEDKLHKAEARCQKLKELMGEA